MKKLLLLFFVLSATTALAQPNTEVYLLDIIEEGGKIEFSNLRNISNNDGYDNQPSFYDNGAIVFASTRNGQTDIAKYDISTGAVSWLTNTQGGSEYSPLRIPGSDDISAVRLDTTGYQRLYRYDVATGTSKEILTGLKVGYHVWMDNETVIASVLVENGMDLMVYDLIGRGNRTVQKSVGRSLHKIPGKDLISFIKFEDDPFTIRSLDPLTDKTEVITATMSSISDVCWMPDGTILAPDGNTISKFNPEIDATWELVSQFEEKEIYKISRMAVSPDGKHLAIVSEVSPALIVQKQVESFNAENLDAFAACYAENVIVKNFPNDTITAGNKALKMGYKRYFDNNPKTTVEVVKRIQLGNIVIDEEVVTRSGKTNRQAAIYEVSSGKITSMTFIHEKKIVPEAEAIIEKNLTAYRARDIDAFLNDYTEDVQVYRYPGTLSYTGKENMRAQYADFLKRAVGLTCEIKNRMIIGNIVIDEEYLTLNGGTHSAVAIYEIENGKIARVTFL